MKIKRFQIVRPEIEVESTKPIISRLYLALIYPTLIKVRPCNLQYTIKHYGGMAGTVWMKKVYIIGIPKILWVDKRN